PHAPPRPMRYASSLATALVINLLVAISCFGDESVVQWNLDQTTTLKQVGNLRPIAGPQAPEFPDLGDANEALRFRGRERITLPSQDRLKFTLGEALSIDAWIAPERVVDNSPRYIVGKGRTGNRGFRRDNQNWALRITPQGKAYRLSFLFATPKTDGDGVRWHRWTSTKTFAAGDGWHHVAVAYRFGDPESIRGWIDGESVVGKWDMQGSTTAAPIVDDDEVWIGSAQRGNRTNSFVGAIDQITVTRRLLDADVIRQRYHRDESIPRQFKIAKPAMPLLGELGGTVQFSLREELPAADAWPDSLDYEQSSEVLTWTGDSFLLPRLPAHFDDWGIRSAYRPNVLLTIAGDIELPTGTHRFMMRSRSLGRLWIDGKLVAETPATLSNAPSGEEPITPVADPPHPGVRPRGYRQQEVFAEHNIAGESASKTCRVVMEVIVGGKNRRIETGEICAAIETTDASSFDVLAVKDAVSRSLQDADAEQHLARLESDLLLLEVKQRRQLASKRDPFWANRHSIARTWAAWNPVAVPLGPADENPIDAFIRQKIERAKAELAASENAPSQSKFHQTVLPILNEHCFRCHGKAAKGDLRLDSREGMLTGGETEWAAIEPGDAESSELILRLQSDDPDQKMPPEGDGPSPEEIDTLAAWIESGANWPQEPIDPRTLETTEGLGDTALLRRLFLDTLGVPPSEDDVRAFLAELAASPRRTVIERWIDRLLDDDRVADHLMADWLDRLAENPSLLNKSLNSTGPFRFFLHDSFLDRKPIDRIVTELILMRGDAHTGGAAGFGIAGENDVPMAAKAHILAGAFLGVELGCARCHDAPFHSSTQSDLFSMAAMLNRQSIAVPESSRVPAAFFENQPRQSLIEVTLAAGERVKPRWTLESLTDLGNLDRELTTDEWNRLMENPGDSRERLAALITAPWNSRFAAVIVNRVWHRLIGQGIVASLNDWEHDAPSHPELLRWLATEFLQSGYDIRHVMRLILTSELYARRGVDRPTTDNPTRRYFAAPIQRRLTAEQVVDSLYAATGTTMDSEELTFVHDGRRSLSNRLTLGRPTRAWMMATLNNERDRPSLSLPKARAIVDVMQAFGWSGSRQRPIHTRNTDANVLQPGVLANGVLVQSLSRASLSSTLADIAVDAESPGAIVDKLFLRFLSRLPDKEEQAFFNSQLREGFSDRIVAENDRIPPSTEEPLPLVHWFNHLRPRANEIQLENERRVRVGPPADPRLKPAWRQRFEDVVWSLINHDEFVWMP
ncbi:MAG: DUF1553 domain-containing protein, partial [Planctomycetota bacterium]